MGSRPVYLYETSLLAARVAVGPPITPSTTISTPQRFFAPETMVIDYIYMNMDGPDPAHIQFPDDVMVEIEDAKRQKWSYQRMPIATLDNIVRGRIEGNMWGDWRNETIANGAQWVVPAGKYQFMISNAGLQLQRQLAAVWAGVGEATGVIESDGINVRVNNTAGQPENVFYQRIDNRDYGSCWFGAPFRLSQQHSITLYFENRMTQPVKFYIVFHAAGEKTGRPYLMEQDIEIAGNTVQPASGLGLQMNTEEPVIIYGFDYGPHPEFQTDENVEFQFDARNIDMQIAPSQGAEWSAFRLPLHAYSNLRGSYASCFHKPLREVLLGQNDYLQLRWYNYSGTQRALHTVVAGHTVEQSLETFTK